MSANTTNVVGYFNPHEWPISLEISELNLRLVLNPKQYITDGQGNYFNDPIFDDYVQPKGLSRTESRAQVALRMVPRAVRAARPAHAVTQATGFVRDSHGQTLPVYATPPQIVSPEAPINKNPVIGMSVETARRLGYAGKPRLVPEDYGLADGQGAPPDKNLPPIRISIESPPRLRTAAPLTPQIAEALNDPALSIEQRQQRAQMQSSLNRAASTASGDDFNPAAVRPGMAPVLLRAPDEPMIIVGASALGAPVPVEPVPKTKAKKGKKIVEAVAEPPSAPVEAAPVEAAPVEASPIQGAVPLDSAMPDPTLESAPAPVDQPEKRFICAADGRGFKYRSELQRYVKAKYPTMIGDLMSAYPPDPDAEGA